MGVQGPCWAYGNGIDDPTYDPIYDPIYVPILIAPHLLQGACCCKERVLQGACIGRVYCLPPLHALAFAMCTHDQLGSAAPALSTLLPEFVRCVVEACVSWPEGQVGELEGMVRLLGGVVASMTC